MPTWLHHRASYALTLIVALLGVWITGSVVVGLALAATLGIAWLAVRRSFRSPRWRLVWVIAAAAATLVAAVQLVPYGRDHSNPPVTGEPVWNVAETRALA